MNSDKINIDAQPTDALMYQQRIIFALIRRRMNILQLAESADMSIIELNEIMEGQMPSITLSQAARIAAALDMSMHDLMLGP
ncbi:MAG: helix-turn-helix domain-containing protein [Clostridia bacterium]|nr:helix-turn-helix domain-containing protein [Clostridia bacterium]